MDKRQLLSLDFPALIIGSQHHLVSATSSNQPNCWSTQAQANQYLRPPPQWLLMMTFYAATNSSICSTLSSLAHNRKLHVPKPTALMILLPLPSHLLSTVSKTILLCSSSKMFYIILTPSYPGKDVPVEPVTGAPQACSQPARGGSYFPKMSHCNDLTESLLNEDIAALSISVSRCSYLTDYYI